MGNTKEYLRGGIAGNLSAKTRKIIFPERKSLSPRGEKFSGYVAGLPALGNEYGHVALDERYPPGGMEMKSLITDHR